MGIIFFSFHKMAQGGTPKHDRKFVKLNIVISISRKKCQQKIFHSSYFFRIFWSRAFFSRRREDIKLGASLLLLVFFLRNFFVKSTCEFDKFQFFFCDFLHKKKMQEIIWLQFHRSISWNIIRKFSTKKS